MRVKIYQFDPYKAEQLNIKLTKEKIPSEIYINVFDGNVDAKNLSELCYRFTAVPPKEYRGRYLNKFDVVEIITDKTNRYYLCDTAGFRRIRFDPSKTSQLSPTMKAILLEPGKTAKVIEMDATYECVMALLGPINRMYPHKNSEVCFVTNDIAKIVNPHNRTIYDENGNSFDDVSGTCLICNCGFFGFYGLNDKDLKKYTDMYKYPETIKCVGNDRVIEKVKD